MVLVIDISVVNFHPLAEQHAVLQAGYFDSSVIMSAKYLEKLLSGNWTVFLMLNQSLNERVEVVWAIYAKNDLDSVWKPLCVWQFGTDKIVEVIWDSENSCRVFPKATVVPIKLNF